MSEQNSPPEMGRDLDALRALDALLERVVAVEPDARIDALDALVDAVDDLLVERRFELVGSWLRRLYLQRIGDEVIATLLTITFPHRDRVDGRAEFFLRAQAVLVMRRGGRREARALAARILGGLR